MSKPKIARDASNGRFVSVTLGRAAWAKISAVEGIHLSPEAKARAASFERQGLSPAERRAAITKAYTLKK